MRRIVLLAYGLLFVNEVLQASILPLLPLFRDEFGLTKVETGAILSTTTFATVLVGIPVGLLADRVGARILMICAGSILVAAPLVQAFADGFGTLLLGRSLFGLAYGTVWTAGPLLIRDSTSTRRASALGGTVTVGGLSYLVGPSFSGFTAEHFGVETPFVAVSVAALLVTTALALTPSPRPVEHARAGLLPALRALRSAHVVKSALVLIALVGMAMGVVHLLVPLRLSENGLSAGEIGAVFSASAAVWIVVSGFVARLGERAVGVHVAGLGAILLAGIFVVPLASLSTAAVIAFVLLRSSFGAPLSTISYPLGEVGARGANLGGGAVLGLMNVVWGLAGMTTPLVAGALAESAGERAAFAVALGVCIAVGSWILFSSRRAAVEYS